MTSDNGYFDFIGHLTGCDCDGYGCHGAMLSFRDLEAPLTLKHECDESRMGYNRDRQRPQAWARCAIGIIFICFTNEQFFMFLIIHCLRDFELIVSLV